MVLDEDSVEGVDLADFEHYVYRVSEYLVGKCTLLLGLKGHTLHSLFFFPLPSLFTSACVAEAPLASGWCCCQAAANSRPHQRHPCSMRPPEPIRFLPERNPPVIMRMPVHDHASSTSHSCPAPTRPPHSWCSQATQVAGLVSSPLRVPCMLCVHLWLWSAECVGESSVLGGPPLPGHPPRPCADQAVPLRLLWGRPLRGCSGRSRVRPGRPGRGEPALLRVEASASTPLHLPACPLLLLPALTPAYSNACPL